MNRVCPFKKMNCAENCALNSLGECAFESLRVIADALTFDGKTAEDIVEVEEGTTSEE